MASNKHFSMMPNINIPRTKMRQDFTHTTAWKLGELIPLDCFMTIPGDSYSLNLSEIVRMSNPIVPIMSNIEMEVHAFFIPWRLLFSQTEEFFGANKTSAGPRTTEIKLPFMAHTNIEAGSVSDYLGKPLVRQGEARYQANIMKERAYNLIWSEWYRAQQLQEPFRMIASDDAVANIRVGRYGSDIVNLNQKPLKVCKKMDYFTAATIAPQYGDEVLLPLGESAELYIPEDGGLTYQLGEDASRVVFGPNYAASQGHVFGLANKSFGDVTIKDLGAVASQYTDAEASDFNTNIKVNLRTATAASVNQIRYAFQVQKYLERANYGTRYFEVLAAHYGVTSPDARLQRPEYLGGQHFTINVQQVLSTAGGTGDDTTKLGMPGANSTTANKSHVFSKAFVEFGYVMVVGFCRQGNHLYSQGLAREDSYREKFDIYSPEFANLGDQAILNKEIMITGDDDADEEVWGYQEHWAELRYRKDRVSSLINPAAPNNLAQWTLADYYENRPMLDKSFIQESRDNLARCLVTGEDGPDFIGDFYFDYTAVRPMPAYSVPGLIDHVGGR